MNILIIHDYSLINYPFHNVLDYREHNMFLLINSKIYTKEYEAIKIHEKKYKKVVAYENFNSNALVEYDAIKINKEYPIDAIIAMDECDIVRAGRLRDYFNINGQGYESALAFRNKLVMKSFVKESGLLVPECRKITTGLDLISFIDDQGYPVYVKPISSAGSFGGFQIRNDLELREFLSTKLVNTIDIFGGYINTFEVENFIDEDLYNINGVVIDNELILYHPSKYGSSLILENIMKLGYTSSSTISILNPLYNVMKEYIQKLIKSLPSPKNFAFHAEVFIDKNMNIILCEIASRPPGGGIIPVMSWNFDINMFEIFTLLQVDPSLIDKEYIISKSNDYKKLYAVMTVKPKEGVFIDANKDCHLAFIKEYNILSDRGQLYSKEGDFSSNGIASFIVCGDDEFHLKNNISKSYEWFWENCTWGS